MESTKIRLDASLLKTLLVRYKDAFENYNPTHRNAEELRSLAKLLWNSAVMIIPRSRRSGLGAIQLMRVFVAFDSQILPPLVLFSNRLEVLHEYNLVDSLFCLVLTRKLCIHSQLLMEVIAEKNAEDEKEILKDCLTMLIYQSFDVRHFPNKLLPYWYTIWSKVLKYPELIREYKSHGFKICSESYSCQTEQLESTLEIRRKTGDKFSEVFGELDAQTIELRIIELVFNCREDKKSPEDILRDFRQCRRGFEEFTLTVITNQEVQEAVSKTSVSDDHDTNLLILRNEIVDFATRDRFSKEIIEESFEFCSRICRIWICNRGIGIEGLIWFSLTVKCLELLNAIVTSKTVIELVREIRKSILASPEQLPVFILFNQNDCILSIVENMYKLSSIATDHTDKNVVLEELLIILEWEYVSFQKSVIFLHERYPGMLFACIIFPDFFVHLINCLSQLEKFDRIMYVYQWILTRMEEGLDRRQCDSQKLREYIQITGISFVAIQHTIFTVATQSQNLNSDIKVTLLNQSMILSKYLLFSSIRVDAQIGPQYARQFYVHSSIAQKQSDDPMQFGNLSSLIVKCHIELELLVELVKFLEEYENLLREYEDCEYILAIEMIKLGYVITKNIEREKALKCVELVEIVSTKIVQCLEIISDYWCPEIEEEALETLKYFGFVGNVIVGQKSFS